jgi:hypothetical protein
MITVAVIREPHELELLRSRRGRRGIQRVILKLPGPTIEIGSAERQINTGLQACGCGVGAVFVVAGLVALLAHHLAVHGVVAPVRIADVAQAIGILMVLALAGKILGITFAEWRLRAALWRIRHRGWEEAPSTDVLADGAKGSEN